MAKVLLAEDDELLGGLVEKTLVRAGHEVTRTRDGREALRLYDPAVIELVLTDLIMPEKEGLELIAALKKIHGDVKIIAMSGGGRTGPDSYLPIAKHMGARAVLRKPFSIDLLMETVAAVLAGREQK